MHVAEVEIDPDTGSLELVRYTAVGDCGVVLNETIVTGQVQGGVAQGIGQALGEYSNYDSGSGQLLAGSFMDYTMPRADHLPMLKVIHHPVPCTTNPIGVKGTGEAGTTAAPPTIVNAIENAISPRQRAETRHAAHAPEDMGRSPPGEGNQRMIDIYTHIMPERFFEELTKTSPKLGNIGARMRNVKPIHDLDVRFRRWTAPAPDYRQVISLPNPPLEDVCDAETRAGSPRVGNDGMAELCAKHPDRFPAFVAADLACSDVDSALEEIERAITQLGARGIQIFTNVAGKPLDLPEFEPVFAAMARYDLPIWLHPARTSDMTRITRARANRAYEMWWCFGWPYETSVAMSRIVSSTASTIAIPISTSSRIIAAA